MFIPHTDAERQAMLEAIGIERLEDLFTDVPEAHKYPTLHLPPRMTEMEILTELQGVQEANETVNDLTSFLGVGAYNHFIPSAVDAIISRGEFLTAYTPYQPEVSQGTLQGIFEYQSLITNLTGMYASNASHYDGATAVAEAVNLAYHQFRGKRHKVVLSSGLHPHYWETVYTYTHGSDVHVVDDEAHLGLNESPADL
ncbi:MAG: glycine dehydrogenase, partial [Gammaproteobacteria bacterium]|nr:glycine dehydrogenase [Gammaproteobacteria bacterium]